MAKQALERLSRWRESEVWMALCRGKRYIYRPNFSLVYCMHSYWQDPLAGVIPRSLHELFEKIEAQVSSWPYTMSLPLSLEALHTVRHSCRMCPSSPSVCRSWSCTMRSCLTSSLLEKTLVPSSGFLRIPLERSVLFIEVVFNTNFNMHTCIKAKQCMYMYVQLHVHVRACTMYKCMYNYMYMYMHVQCMYNYMYMHVCTCTCANTLFTYVIGFCCNPRVGGTSGPLQR